MFHPTARRLDEPYKLYGFTVAQWLVLIFGGGGTIAGLYYLHVGLQFGGFVGTLIVGAPALYWLLGESGRIEPAELLLDAARKVMGPSGYEPGAGALPHVLVVEASEMAATGVESVEVLELPWD